MVLRQFSVLAPYFCVWCIPLYSSFSVALQPYSSASYRHSSYYPYGPHEVASHLPEGIPQTQAAAVHELTAVNTHFPPPSSAQGLGDVPKLLLHAPFSSFWKTNRRRGPLERGGAGGLLRLEVTCHGGCYHAYCSCLYFHGCLEVALDCGRRCATTRVLRSLPRVVLRVLSPLIPSLR